MAREAPPERTPATIEIGVVARAHGIKGEVRVHLHNPASTALAEADSLFVGEREYRIELARPVAGAYLVALEGVPDRNAAEALRGRPVSVARGDLELEEGEVLLADLVGCRVELPDGSDWGTVSGLELGPQDRLVIRQGEVERLLPVVDAFVIDVDVEARRIVVDPPDDLPEDKAPMRVPSPRASRGAGREAPPGVAPATSPKKGGGKQ